MLTYLRKKMKTIMLVVVIIFAASMFYGIGMSRSRGGGGDNRIKGLAKVNGREIDVYLYREFLNRITRQLGDSISAQEFAFVESQALQQTIDFTILLQEAKKRVRISGKELDMAVNNVMAKGKFSSRKDLERSLKSLGMSMRKFREMLKNELLVAKLMRKMQEEITVSPDDLREVKARHILASTEADANEMIVKLKRGEKFYKLARKYSIDPGSKDKGGDLGYFTTGMMVGPFEKAAFTLKIGEVSDVVKSPFGYHVIEVTDTRLRKFKGGQKDIEKAALAEKRTKEYQKWFSKVRSKIKVEISHPGLKGHAYRFRGQLLEAIEEYKKAIRQSPNNAYLHVFLGDAYYSIGKKDLAIKQYQEAIRVEGGRPEFYMILGMAYEKIGKKGLATKEYKKVSMIAGDNKKMHEDLVEIFKKLGAWKEVRAERAEIKRIEKKEKFEKSLSGD
ncbi:MAG: peptidylprolyl isomerase [Candidatus Margulisiibacteriota bacterium]|nr:peptidylprolyl isomerase [Candidatus Margulisiibacteriota bacterium]